MQRLVVCVDGVLQLGNSINVSKTSEPFLSSFCRECNAQINLSRRCNKELVEVAILDTHQMQLSTLFLILDGVVKLNPFENKYSFTSK